MKMIKFESCGGCPKFITDCELWELDGPVKSGKDNTPILSDCPLGDYEETRDLFDGLRERIAELETELKERIDVVRECRHCGCTELLCGHNKRG